MALVIEDGTGTNPAVNSYDTLENIKAFMTARGYTVPADNIVEQLAIRAFDYINSFRTRYQGTKTTSTQNGQFPRENLQVDGFDIANNVVPNIVKQAQAELVNIGQTINFTEATSGAAIRRERVGPIETEFAVVDGQSQSTQVDLPAVEALLKPLFKSGGAFALSIVRV